MNNDEFSEIYARYREFVINYLGRLSIKYPRLLDAGSEDLAHVVFMESLRETRKPDFESIRCWEAWLRQIARNVAIDYLRKRYEAVSFDALACREMEESSAWEPPDTGPTPSQVLSEMERGERQKRLMSEILQEYVQQCERTRGHSQKEVYERTLRGESPAKIAPAMGISVNGVYQHLRNARSNVIERVKSKDVNKSVFETILGDRPDAPPRPPEDDRQKSFVALLRWLVEELGAMCPSSERLEAFAANPKEPSFHDLRFHVNGAGCKLCQSLLADR